MVTTRRGEKLEEKKREIEKKKWEIRRKDCSSSDSDGEQVAKTNKIVHSKVFPKGSKSASSVPLYPSDQSQQTQAKTDVMNKVQEAEGSGGERVPAKFASAVSGSNEEAEESHEKEAEESDGEGIAKSASIVSGSEGEAEESDEERVETKSSTVSGSNKEAEESREKEAEESREKEAEESHGERVGAKYSSTISGSNKEAEESHGGAKFASITGSGSDEEVEEIHGDGVWRKGGKSASTASGSDKDAEESDGDRVKNMGVKTPEILSPQGSAKRRPLCPSDRMKKFREEQAAIDGLNPDASRPPHRPYNMSFLTEKNRLRYNLFLQKGVVDQRLVDLGSFSSLGVEQILKENHLLGTVICVEPYVLEVVMEFYANLPTKEETPSKYGQKIFFRGKMYDFSPKLINAILECPIRKITRSKETWIDVDLNLIAATLTGGSIKEWRKITPGNLSPPIAALHGICCANWIPTSNPCTLTLDRAKLLYMLVKKIPFNFGKLAYDQICRLGHKEGSKHTPVFPSLIYQVLDYQRAIHLHKGESLNLLPKPICYHIRLSRGKHVSLPSPSSGKRKHVSSPSPSGPKKKRKHVSFPSALVNDKHKLKVRKEPKGNLVGAMALIDMVSDKLEASGQKELKGNLIGAMSLIDMASDKLEAPGREELKGYLVGAMALIDMVSDKLDGLKELKGYLVGAMALIHMVSDKLEADEEETDDDDDARTG